ncbi:MAG TPA: glycogen synthase GlgA [Clostridiales bacterium]|nr:glycogen synthase GlgA [Clostridiales bacterium]
MKVLYAVSEARPFVVSGGLADVAGSLPQALRKRMVGVRVVLPLYDSIPQEYKDQMKFITHITVPVAWRRQYCGIFEYRQDGVVYYFLDNQYYFKRDGLYGYYDDAERFAFFSRAILEIIPYINFKPDIIHCNDWQTALTPVYYTAMYSKNPDYHNIKTVLTIHNIQYQGLYGMELIGDIIGLDGYDVSLVEYDACVNFLKGGIECSNKVTTVSPSYAKEILDPWYSHGLDSILRAREWKLQGILNGISTDYYNPEDDEDIAANYSAQKPKNKAKCKAALQKKLGLPENKDTPIIGMVSRLVSHKGLDLVKTIAEELVSAENVQLAVLGSGDKIYEDYFKYLAEKYPDKVSFTAAFDAKLAKEIYAGSDMFLMPSKSEPCGLSQMIALRYGSIPIVRETGGLKDSVFDSGLGEGNGFTFSNYNAHDLLHCIRRAIEGYKDKKGWAMLQQRAMESDYSWKRSAGEYIKMYKEILD